MGSYAPTRLLATVRTMESRRPPYHHAGLAAAGRDLAADWRRWSAAVKQRHTYLVSEEEAVLRAANVVVDRGAAEGAMAWIVGDALLRGCIPHLCQ